MSSQSHSSLALITGLLSARHSSCSKVTSYFWKDNRVSVYPHSSTLCQDDRSQMRDKLVQGWVSWGGQLIVSPISESGLWATVLASPRKAAEGKWRYHKTFPQCSYTNSTCAMAVDFWKSSWVETHQGILFTTHKQFTYAASLYEASPI